MSGADGEDAVDHAAVEHGLLERSAELGAADEVLARACGGHGSLFVVEGVAGIGKSTLLTAAVDRARRRGCTVLASRASELEREFPFGVVLQLFEPHLASLPPADREALLDPLTPPARLLLEGGAEAELEPATAGGREAFVVLRGLHRLVSAIADLGPLVVVVDDLQWCDEPSIRFLRYLAARVEDLPVAVLLATRPASKRVEHFLATADADQRVTLVRPRPLSEPAVAALVRETFGDDPAPEFVAECHAATGGTPFLVRQLLSTLVAEVARPDAAAAALARDVAPEILLRRVRRRLDELAPASKAVLHAVAVLGMDAQLRNVAALAGVDDDTTAALADALIAERILAVGHTFGFSHPVIEAAAVDQLTPTQRAALHARAFDRLAEEGVAPDRLAIHAVAAVPAGRRDIVDLLLGAARRARARGAPDAAVTYLRRALAEPPARDMRPQVLVELASAESAVGDPGALARLHGALSLLDEPVRRAEVWERIGDVLLDAGDHDGAADAFERGRAEAAVADPAVALRLEAGYVVAARTNLATRADAHRRLEAILDRGLPGSGPAERKLLAEAAYRATLIGQRARAIDFAMRALAPAREAAGDDSPFGDAFYPATLVLFMSDELAAAGDAIEAALTAARRSGSARMFAAASHLRAALEYRLGQLGDCVVDAQAALEGSQHGWNIVLPSTHAYLALALLEQGDVEAARRAIALPGDDDQWSASSPFIFHLYGRGRVLAESGDLDEAVRVFREVGSRQEVMGAQASTVIPWRSWAAWCLGAQGDGDRAEALRLAAEEVRLARSFGSPHQIGVALAAWGALEGGTAGIARLREAVRLLARAKAPVDEARARLRLAQLQAGDQPSTRTNLVAAFDLAAACGAGLLATAIEQELAAIGAPAPSASRPVPRDPLTPLERRVASLVAEGRTDRDIADALFLPVRSVAEHVAAIRRKLRVSSMEQLRRCVEDERAAAAIGQAATAVIGQPSVAAVEVRLLGTEIRVGDRVVALPRGTPTRLVQVVGAGLGDVGVDEVIEQLWPDEQPDRARGRLRHALYRLRQAAGPIVVRDGDRVRFADGVAPPPAVRD